MRDAGKGAGDGKARAEFPSTVGPDRTDDERRMGDDVVEEGDGIVLGAAVIDLCQREPGPVIEAIERDSLCGSAPRKTRIQLDFLSHFFLHVQLGLGARQTNRHPHVLVTCPDPPDGRGMDAMFLRKMSSDIIDVPIVMRREHVHDGGFRCIRAPVPCPAVLRSGLLWQESVDAGSFVPGHPGIDRGPALFHGAGGFGYGNLAGEDMVNERGFHGCERVSVVGFHASTLNECVNLIAAIRTPVVK